MWSGIDVQLKRRHDLVPRLIETVKGVCRARAARVLESLTDGAREGDRGERTGAGREGPRTQLNGAFTELRAVAENYPQLRATENFQQFKGDSGDRGPNPGLAPTKDKTNVQAYNKKILIFPYSIVAGMGGFLGLASSSRSTRKAEREPVDWSFNLARRARAKARTRPMAYLEGSWRPRRC